MEQTVTGGLNHQILLGVNKTLLLHRLQGGTGCKTTGLLLSLHQALSLSVHT